VSPRTKLTNTERRGMVLALLSGTSAIELSKRYGVARSWVYAAADEAKRNPETAIEEARQELDFRKKVYRLVG